MRDDGELWRAAATAADLDAFVTTTGTALLDHFEASSVVVRRLVSLSSSIETVAAMKAGRRGLSPVDVRVKLTPVNYARIEAWMREGTAQLVGAADDSGPPVELLAGLSYPSRTECIAVPIVRGRTHGVLLASPREVGRTRLKRYEALAAPVSVVLANDDLRREMEREREAARADKEAALARLHVRDIDAAIIGADSGLRAVFAGVEQVASTDTPVLVLGETGSGKELVARAVHERSPRARGPILRVNCGAIPPELVDSELFGHERGSFTGATSQRRGWFERADGGTLFLDEIGDLPLAAQVRLLRVLQDGIFERVGGERSIRVDVRVVAATHRDLETMVERGAFRKDLWYRISVFALRLPALRDRLADLPALAQHFAERVGRRYGSRALPLSASDLAQLASYSWPGNVRELAAVIERAAVLGGGSHLDITRALGAQVNVASLVPARLPASPDLPAPPRERGPFPTLDDALRAHIERALGESEGRIEGRRGAARLLQVNPHTLRSKMRKLGLDWRRFRAPPQPAEEDIAPAPPSPGDRLFHRTARRGLT